MNETRLEDARFICRMAAGTTHEFRNVLAIIAESAGLIQDLTATGGGPDQRAQASVERALQRIDRQVARGAELVSALNGLAHGLDQECEWLDLAEQARGVAVLCRHWTNQQERRVTVAPELGVRVCTSRLRLCQLLAAAIEYAARAAAAGTEVTVAGTLRDDGPALTVHWTAAADPATETSPVTEPGGSALLEAAAAVGGSLLRTAAAPELVVLFPGSPERA